MTHTPNWWQTLLLALAAFRLWRLIAFDVVTERLRRRMITRQRLFADPGNAAEFVQCPWCLGFWIALAWWAAWLAWPHGTLIAAAPFAISAAVGLVVRLDP